MTDVAIADWELPAEVDPAMVEIERLRLIDPMPLRKMVDDFRDGTQPSQSWGEIGRRYFDGDQLFGENERALRRSRQPRVIRNEITPAVNGMLGVIQQAKTDPKAQPRSPGNEDQADQASKALRYVADTEKWNNKKVDGAETFFIEGIAAAAVEATEDGDVQITQLAFDEVIYDPHSRKADFSDAAYKGLGKWMYEGDLIRRYPLMRDDLSAAFSSTWGSAMGLDRPDKPENALGTNWLDPKKRRIFVVELYHLEDGKWIRSVFYVGGVLEQAPSVYVDDRGNSLCAFIFESYMVTRDNQRVGAVRFMISNQDEVNSYGSRALHLAKSRQLKVSNPEYPPEVDSKTASAEAAKPDGVIPTGYEPVATADLMQGMQLMMAEARQALVRQAPTPAVLADASASNQSGRSRLVLQQAGMTESARSRGRLDNWENNVFRMAWAILKQFKKKPWWVRMTSDDKKKAEFIGFNIPAGPDGQPLPPEMVQAMEQQGIEPPSLSNELAKMDVDIEIEPIPDTANLQAEQFETLAPMFPLLAEAVGPKKAFEIGVTLSSIPEKQRIKDLIEKPDELTPEQQAQAQQQAQMQQQIEQMQLQLAQMAAEADIQVKQSTAALNMARAQQVGADMRETEADTVLKAAQFNLGQPIDAS